MKITKTLIILEFIVGSILLVVANSYYSLYLAMIAGMILGAAAINLITLIYRRVIKIWN